MGRRQRFRGESRHKVDGKGRVSIPAGFRRVLEAGDPAWVEGRNPEFVIVYGGRSRRYLECYTMHAIEEVDEQIEALPRGSDGRRALERMFSAQSLDSSVDETGRIVLAARLREKIGLTSEAIFVAAGDTFQIWAPDAYEDEVKAVDEWEEELPEGVDPLSFLQPKAGSA